MTIPDPPFTVEVHGHSWTVSHWVHDIDSDDPFDRNRIVLDAPYQRGSVWTVDQRRALIRSLLTGVPVASIIYASVPYGAIPDRPGASYRVIDGKQRIETVQAFVRDEFTIPGWWLTPEWADDSVRGRDVYYSDIPAPIRRDFANRPLPGAEVDSFRYRTPNPVYDPEAREGYGGVKRGDPRLHKYEWHDRTNDEAIAYEAEVYLLVNFGGTPQTDENRANAEQYAGPS